MSLYISLLLSLSSSVGQTLKAVNILSHEYMNSEKKKTEKDYEKQTKCDREFSLGVREVLFEGILFKQTQNVIF